jgi:hypothetical protein
MSTIAITNKKSSLLISLGILIAIIVLTAAKAAALPIVNRIAGADRYEIATVNLLLSKLASIKQIDTLGGEGAVSISTLQSALSAGGEDSINLTDINEDLNNGNINIDGSDYNLSPSELN